MKELESMMGKLVAPVFAALLAAILTPGAGAQSYEPVATSTSTLAAKGYPRLAFDPSGTRLAVSLRQTGEKGRIDFLSVPDLGVIQGVQTESEPCALAFSRQGDYFALSLAKTRESDDLRFVVLSTTDWKALYAERGLKSEVASLAFDPVGDLLLSGGADPADLYRFSVGTWQREKIPPLEGTEAGCQSLAVSPDSRYGAIGTPTAKLLVWPLDDSDQALILGSQQFRGPVTAVAFSPKSDLLAAGDSMGTVMSFYRTSDGLWAWKMLFNLPSGGVTGLGFLQDGSLVTASSEGSVSRWNLADTSQPTETFIVGPGNAVSMAISPNGRWLAIGGEKLFLYPLGSPEPLSPTEMPAASWTVVSSGNVDMTKPARDVPAVLPMDTQPGGAQEAVPRSEDVGNFLIWCALGEDAGDGNDWIQAWAASLDEGRYTPLQVVLPSDTMSTPVMKSNLGNLGKILTGNDYNVFYTAAILSATQEAGDFRLGLGPNGLETILVSDWIKALQASSGQSPTIWFLDLRSDPGMEPEKTASLFDKVTRKIAFNEDGTKRHPIGVGLLVLSKHGSFPELSGNLPDALSGKADTSGDGQILDRELILYLADRCRTASRVQPMGDAQNPIPVLPPFRLQGNP
jgi:WD40 repeat protein